jgi:hypothetical protein
MADVNLTPGSMASAGGSLTDREDTMTAPGSAPAADPDAAPWTDARPLAHGESGGQATSRWDDVSERRQLWR